MNKTLITALAAIGAVTLANASLAADEAKKANDYAPGQLKKENESAKSYAPGQIKNEGESAKEYAPGQRASNGASGGESGKDNRDDKR